MRADGQLETKAPQSGFAQSYVDGIGATPPELIVFTAPEPEASSPTPARAAPRPEILAALESTAHRYGGHPALRRAGLSVTEWQALFQANIEIESAYSFGDELMVDIQQIIPTPEAADFMIGMSSKENEEKAIQDTQKKRHKLRLDFWEAALEQLRVDGVTLYQNISPTKDHWLSAGSGTRSCPYQMIFSRDEARVEISLQRSETAENKWLFDQLYGQKDAIEAAFGAELDWRRMDDKKASRIVYAQPFDGFNREAWPEMIGWLAAHIQKLEAAFSEPLARLNRQVRSQDEAT
jgi:hypothetical protein